MSNKIGGEAPVQFVERSGLLNSGTTTESSSPCALSVLRDMAKALISDVSRGSRS